MVEEITIKQAWNGWIIEYTNVAGIDKQFVFQEWKDVLRIINKNFGFMDEDDNPTKDASKSWAVKKLPELN